jgi:hypothetical protein
MVMGSRALLLTIIVVGTGGGCAYRQPQPAAAAALAPAGPPPADPGAVQSAAQERINRVMSIANRVEVVVDPAGVANLSGFVSSELERDQAIRLARETPGVTGVVEDLRVMPIFRTIF